MRNLFHAGVLVAACLLLTSGLRLQAQRGGGQMGGQMGVSEPFAAGGARNRPPQGQTPPAAGSGTPMTPITAPMPGAPTQ
jgi:hypothetical protein